jgi:hypothetical protein
VIALSLALRFALELALLVFVAIWAASLDASGFVRLVVAIGAPVLIALIWGRWVAPKATARLADPERFVLEVALFAIGGVAAAANWGIVIGVAFAIVAISNAYVVRRSGGEAVFISSSSQ